MTLEEYIVHNDHIVIYGAGSIGQRFYGDLQRRGMDNKVEGFAVTTPGDVNNILGQPVKDILDYSKDYAIVIAVHKVLYDEMRDYLDFHQYGNYYGIATDYLDYHYGKPIKTNVFIDVKELVRNIRKSYSHVIYLIAIEEISKKTNTIGISLYEKYMSSFCDKKTASKRVDALIRRVNTYYNDDDKYNIKINKNKTFVIDGTHRLMLAYNYGKCAIAADVYDISEDECLKWGEACLTEERIKEIFDENEIQIIASKYTEIIGNTLEESR